jgi:endonuclease/exonuclease/phosphatase (EEP) superfamily protein YafD
VEKVAWNYLFAEMVEENPREGREALVLNVLAVHLHPYHVQHTPKGAFDRSRVTRAQHQEANALIRRVAGLKDPTILAGDFNSTRDLPLHLGLRAHLADVHEKASWGPGWTVRAFGSVPLKVDYVYVEPSIVVESATIPSFDCSDHRPVFAVVGLSEKSG